MLEGFFRSYLELKLGYSDGCLSINSIVNMLQIKWLPKITFTFRREWHNRFVAGQ